MRLKELCCGGIHYIQVILKDASNAKMVSDKFHIVRHLNKAVNQVRGEEIRDKNKQHKKLVKDIRYVRQ